jgi:dTDP-4-amino-4,6-dideoxygalactose transaminase
MTDASFIPQANPLAGYLAQKAEIDAAIARVMASGRYILGREVEQFEREFANYLGLHSAVGVASGTDAVELCLRGLGIGAGDAVVTVSHTAVATVAAIERAGATPVLVDIDPATYTMDPSRLEEALAEVVKSSGLRARAILPVHLYGYPAAMPELVDVARQHKLHVIEDCAQAHGAKLGGRIAGTFGDLAAFSFYPTKNLGAFGDGGLIAGDDGPVLARVRALREYGWQERYVSAMPGVNSRLDEIQAAMLRVRLQQLDAGNARRGEIAARYTAGLDDTPLSLPIVAKGVTHAWHQYVVQCGARDDLRSALERTNIGTAVHYPAPVHLQPAYRGRIVCSGELAHTERAAGRILSLPMYPQLTDAQVDRVIDAIRSIFSDQKTRPEGGRPS